MSGNENEKSNNNEFNKERLRKIVEELAFPRLTGSDGAKKAVDYCKSLFKEIDINLNSEKFYATKFYVGALLQGVAVLAIILTILMTYLFVSYIPYNLIILFIVLGILAALAPKIGGSGELKPIGKKIETENLWASIPAKKERTGYIILMGHHDSKSQTLSTVQRSASYVFLFVGLIFMILVQLIYGLIALVSLLRNTSFILPNWVKIANYIFAAITILSSIPLMLNFLGNKSPGALDNASSVAVLYELARVLRENPLENYEVIIVITGAEELGMIGAREFVKQHLKDFPPDKTYILNFDMIGYKGAPVEFMETEGFPAKRPVSPRLTKIIKEEAEKNNITVKGFYLPTGAATDRFVFSNKGYDGIDFSVREAAFRTHRPGDAPERFDPKIAAENCKLAMAVMKHLDSEGIIN